MLIHGDMLQKLVDKIIEDIGYNINIIDTNGIIIASGHGKRIGTFHKIGKQASEEERRIDIFPCDENHYEGVKAGINQPFYHKATLMGVIGITGIPEEISELSNIVKSMIELMYEQEVLKRKMYYRQSDKTYFLNELLNLSGPSTIVTTKYWGEKLGYDMNTRRGVIFVEFQCMEVSKSSFVTQEKIQEIYQLIKANAYHNKNDISTVVSSNRIVILKASTEKDNHRESSQLQRYVEEIQKCLSQETIPRYYIACGSYYEDLNHIKDSYYEAEFVLNQLKGKGQLERKNQCGFIEDSLLAYSISKMPQHVMEHFFEADYTILEPIHGMLETIVVMYESNMNVSQCAKTMFLHRNTIISRLKKIKELLDIEPTEHMRDRMRWYLFAEYIKGKK